MLTRVLIFKRFLYLGKRVVCHRIVEHSTVVHSTVATVVGLVVSSRVLRTVWACRWAKGLDYGRELVGERQPIQQQLKRMIAPYST